MSEEPRWNARAVAAEFWLATLFVAGSFVAGLIAAIRYLLG